MVGRSHLGRPGPAAGRDCPGAEIAELCASEALTSEGGKLVRRPVVEGRQNHLWDAAGLAIHARNFRPLSSSRRRLRLVVV